MRLVLADTGPINYLILIGHIEILPRLFERVALPAAVCAELSSPRAPLPVRHWIGAPPAWLEIHETAGLPLPADLDEGEAAAIALAESLRADLLLIDERDGFRAAQKRGLHVTGTIGILDVAANRGLIDFADAVTKLEQTNFRRPMAILKALLEKHRKA